MKIEQQTVVGMDCIIDESHEINELLDHFNTGAFPRKVLISSVLVDSSMPLQLNQKVWIEMDSMAFTCKMGDYEIIIGEPVVRFEVQPENMVFRFALRFYTENILLSLIQCR